MKISKIVMGLALAALPAMCSTILPDGSWYSFQWSGLAPTAAFGASPGYTGAMGTIVKGTSGSSWDFVGSASLSVQDLFFDGDQFQVVIDGVIQPLLTSTPFNDGTACGADPLGCTSVKFSSGLYNIPGGGSHLLTINVVGETTGISAGKAVFQLGAAVAPGVPEPATLGLIGLGLVGLAFRWRAKHS